MLSIFRAIFSPLPKAGEIFIFYDFIDPWEDKRHKVEVIDAAAGWVRYKFCGSEIYTDLRMEKRSFNFCYVKSP